MFKRIVTSVPDQIVMTLHLTGNALDTHETDTILYRMLLGNQLTCRSVYTCSRVWDIQLYEIQLLFSIHHVLFGHALIISHLLASTITAVLRVEVLRKIV